MDFRRQERWKLYMLKSRADHETLASDTSVKWTPPQHDEKQAVNRTMAARLDLHCSRAAPDLSQK
jgi:hypothetical protein